VGRTAGGHDCCKAEEGRDRLDRWREGENPTAGPHLAAREEWREENWAARESWAGRKSRPAAWLGCLGRKEGRKGLGRVFLLKKNFFQNPFTNF
jgi:hypothetical protein